jgi:hypothetical protein
MDYDDESSISTLSVDSNPQHKMHLLYWNNLVTRDVSMAEMTPQHEQFFSENIEQDGKGFQQLISKAVLDHPNCATTTVENLYHLNVAKFCTRLDHGQKVAFADIMKTTIHPDTFKHTRPPHSLGDINKFYTKSKYSIFNALPSPTIHNYEDLATHYGVDIIETEHEGMMCEEYGQATIIQNFPERTSPFWNMKHDKDGIFNKVDVILYGQETIGSAERATSIEEMRHYFDTISDGGYKKKLYDLFGKERVEKELDEYFDNKFFPRFGGGIGITRLIRALKMREKELELTL